MKIVLATFGSRGDVQPMLALALGLQAAGHTVRLLGPPERAAWAASLGCPYRSLGIDVTAFIDRVGTAHTLRAVPHFIGFLHQEIGRQFKHLPGLITGADLVIGASLSLALPSAAEAAGIPYRFVAFTPQLLPSGKHPCPVFRYQRRPAWFNRLGWGLFHVCDRLDLTRRVNRHRRRLGLAPLHDGLRALLGHRVIVATDSRLAPLPPDVDLPAVQTGYLHLAQPHVHLPALEAFLAAGSPPVYAGFGSMPWPDQERLIPLVTAAARAVGRRVVIARFGEAAAMGPARTRDVFFIRRYPHTQLFPRMAAVIHHGGAGTTATAAISGVPQVVVPHILDQFYWGERVRRIGLGPPPIHRAALSASKLAAALIACLENVSIIQKAHDVRDVIRRQDALGNVISEIETRAPQQSNGMCE